MIRHSIFRSNKKSLILAFLLLTIGLLVSFVAYQNFREYRASLIEQKVATESHIIKREIEVLRYIVELLARNPIFIGLDDKSLPRQKMAALIYLKQIQHAESILAAYVLDKNGTCLVSSKHSFEGKNYGFRPYFTEATAKGSGSYFAYGVTSKRLGLYFSRRIDHGAGVGGVVVLKVDPLELLVKAGLVPRKGGRVKDIFSANGIVSQSGVFSFPGAHELRVLDSSVLQQKSFTQSRQFPVQAVHNMGLAPGTWGRLRSEGVLHIALNGEGCSIYLQPVLSGGFYYFHSFRDNYVGTGIALLARTMLLLVGSFFLALIPLIVFLFSVERQRVRLRDMGEKLVREKRINDENLLRFKSVIDQNKDGFWIVQPDGFVVESVNTTLCSMLGRSAEDLVGKSPAELFATDDLPDVFAKEGIFYADRGSIRANLRGMDGNFVPVYIEARLMRDSTGKPLFRYSFITDLRQQIKNLEKIRLLEAAVEQSASSIVITDVDGQIRYVNPAFTKVSGYSREEALGKNPKLLQSGRQKSRFYKQMWQKISTGKVWHGRFCNKKKDGSIYWEDAVIAPVRNEEYKITHFVAVKNDVTEKVRIEGQLQDKLAELELIVEHAGAGIAYIKGRKILGINEAAAKIIGFPIEQLLLKDTRILFPGDGEYEQFGLVYYPELRRGNIVDVEFQTKNGKGEEIWVRLTGQAVDRTALDEKGAVWIIQDMTAVHEYQNKLEEAKKQAEAVSRSKSNFLANMSHEIRTPMNAIIGMTRLVQASELDPLQKKYVNRIETSSTMLLGLLNGILDFSKIEAGQLLLEEQPFLLETLLDNVYSTMIGLARDKKLTLILDQDKDVPEAFIGDAVRLGQILVNLIGNGIKFTDQGEISVHVCLDVASSTEKEKVLCFTVKDTGIGIPKEKQRRLFGSFQQADSSISRRYGGTGLGLAISRQLVQLMGGDISLTSTEGIGTTFSFTIALPSCDKEKVQQVCRLDGDNCSRVTGLTILLVEDNEANRELGTIILESSGQKVQVAEHGLRALELLCATRFDVILMDVQMPEMDGVTATRIIRAVEGGKDPETLLTGELLAQLKRRLGGGHVPIIALTAHAMDSDRRRCMDAGMDEYLTKPFQPEQVVDVLQKFGGKETTMESPPASDEPVPSAVDHPNVEEDLVSRVRAHLSATYKLQPEQVDQLLVTSARSLSEHLDKALAALEAENGELLREAAHALKGNLLNLGLQEYAQTAAMIEQRAGAGDTRSCNHRLTSLQTALAELVG